MSCELLNSPDILARAFGEVLRTARKERGLSQENLADKSGYHRTYISLLERGLKSPSLQTIFQLAYVLNIPPSKLLEDVERVMHNMTI